MKKLFIVLFALMASGLFAEWICDVNTDPITDESRVVFIYTEGGFLSPVTIIVPLSEFKRLYEQYKGLIK